MKTIQLLAILYLSFYFSSCQKEDLEPGPQSTLEPHTESSVKFSSSSFLSILRYPPVNTTRPMFYKTATTVFQHAIWKVTSFETDDLALTVSRSTDGTSWTKMTVIPDNYSPGGLELVVFNEELWLLGNRAPEDRFYTPLFKSKDGITWKKVLGPFASRTPKNIFVFGERLYVQTVDGSMLSTINGDKWVGVTHFLPNAMSKTSKILVFKNAIYAFTAGSFDFSSGTSIPVQIWKSTNARDWNLLPTTHPFFSPRGGYSVAVYKDKIWVVGGHYYSNVANTTFNEIWYSKDLTTWEKYRGKNPLEPMYLQSEVVFQKKLWLFNGTKNHLAHTNIFAIYQKY